jgi:hypothetical protein
MKRIIYSAMVALAITTASAQDHKPGFMRPSIDVRDDAAITDNTIGIKVVDTIAGTNLKLIQSRFRSSPAGASITWMDTASILS